MINWNTIRPPRFLHRHWALFVHYTIRWGDSLICQDEEEKKNQNFFLFLSLLFCVVSLPLLLKPFLVLDFSQSATIGSWRHLSISAFLRHHQGRQLKERDARGSVEQKPRRFDEQQRVRRELATLWNFPHKTRRPGKSLSLYSRCLFFFLSINLFLSSPPFSSSIFPFTSFLPTLPCWLFISSCWVLTSFTSPDHYVSFIIYFTFFLLPRRSLLLLLLFPTNSLSPYSFNYPLKAIGHGVYTAFTASTAQSEEDINGAGTDLVFSFLFFLYSFLSGVRNARKRPKWKRRR